MQPTEIELSTALMALRAIAYQAEKQLAFLECVAAKKDALDQAEMTYLQSCLDTLNPAIRWLDEQSFARKKAELGYPDQPVDV